MISGAVPRIMAIEDHIAALAERGTRLLSAARSAGLEADVVTCRSWNVRALVAHQTMVHRWATAHLTGGDPDSVPNQTTLRSCPELLDEYSTGLVVLLEALRNAPDDLVAMTFLNDAPAPKAFWARRQAHETTIHAVDALAAELGRVPLAVEAEISTDLAADGIDELLVGFFTRGRSKLFDGHEYTVAVQPTDIATAWIVQIAEQLTVTATRETDTSRTTAVELTGTAAQLYLGLWNRGDEIVISGDPAFAERWRRTQRIRWS